MIFPRFACFAAACLAAPAFAAPVYTYNTFTVGGAGSTNNTVTGINNAGDVTGYYHPNVANGEIINGFILKADGTMLSVEPGNTYDQVESFGINNSDTVSGWNDFVYNANRNSTEEAFFQPLGSSDTYYEGPGTPPYATYGYGINDSGTMVGYYRTSTSEASFLYDGTNLNIIADPGETGDTFAYGINDSGEVVGYYLGAGGIQHGFLRNADGSVVNIDAPGAAHGTVATSINSQGDIGGYFYDGVNLIHGFVYIASTQSFETIDLGADTRTYVYGINDSDQISGTFRTATNANMDFIGTDSEAATPEPGSLLLLMGGLAILASRKIR